MWGKVKLGPVLWREGFVVSDSTVGRIIAYLVSRGVVEPVPTLRRAQGRGSPPMAPQTCAVFAKRDEANAAGRTRASRHSLGQWVNVRPDKAIKQFTAYDPVARFTAAKAFSAATAGCGANFLDKIVTAFPFVVKAMQVDGGSEFMAEFEQACKDKGLTLFVVPPKWPDLNGALERAQSSWR